MPPLEDDFIYVYLGRSSFADDDVDANFDVRFNLSTTPYSGQNRSSEVWFTFADVNNDGKTDFIVSRPSDQAEIGTRDAAMTFDTDYNTTTSRLHTGISYVLYQPSTCPDGICWWGSLPKIIGINKDFYADYFFTGDYGAQGDGTLGMQIVGGVDDEYMAVQGWADMNKDNKIDLILSSSVNPTGGYFLFGKSNWPAAYDTNCTRLTPAQSSGMYCSIQVNLK